MYWSVVAVAIIVVVVVVVVVMCGIYVWCVCRMKEIEHFLGLVGGSFPGRQSSQGQFSSWLIFLESAAYLEELKIINIAADLVIL